jgi:hypothetical protein
MTRRELISCSLALDSWFNLLCWHLSPGYDRQHAGPVVILVYDLQYNVQFINKILAVSIHDHQENSDPDDQQVWKFCHQLSLVYK